MIDFSKYSVCMLFSMILISCTYRLPRQPEVFKSRPSLEEGQRIAEKGAERDRVQLPADHPTSMSLSRDGAILTALSRNRSLAVERYAPQIAATRAPESMARFDPILLAIASMGRSKIPIDDAKDTIVTRDFSGEVRLEQYHPSGADVFLAGGLSRTRDGSSDWEYGGSWSVGVNQALLRGAGSLVNLISVVQAQNAETISSYQLEGFIQNLVLQVELAYWNLVLARETVKIRQFSVKLAQEQLQLNKDFIKVGKLSPDARVSAEAELASREADLVDALADVKAKTIALIRLLDPRHDAQWSLVFDTGDPPVIENVQVDAEISAQLADLYRPEIFQAYLDRFNKKLEIIRTQNGLLPKLDAFASYGRLSAGDSSSNAYDHLDDTEFDNYELGLSFELPLGNRAAKARRQRAEIEELQAQAAIRNLEQLIEAEVRRTAVEVQRQAQRIPATQKVVESRQEELRVEKTRFRVGLSTNLDVLRIERDLIQAQLDKLTARIRYIQSLSSLYYTEGTLLLRRGVEVEKQYKR